MDDEHNTPTWLERSLSVERAKDTATTGEFSAILASEGEASDGHILSMAGLRIPESMPLLFRHQSTQEIPALGRITNPRRTMVGGLKSMRVDSHIDMGGKTEDMLASIRRGIAHMVGSGTLDAMSVRWDEVPGKTVARRNLPSDHFAFVNVQKEPDHPGAWGAFFAESIGREGSIVAIGADPTALMGRSEETDDELEQTFWVALARSVEANSGGMGEIVAGFEAVRREVENLRGLGCDDANIVNAMGALAGLTDEDMVPCHYGSGRTLYVPREAWTQLRAEKSSEYWAALQLAAQPAKETSREVPVETGKEKTETAKPRVLGGAALHDLIHETATESASRRLGEALGRITR